MGMYDYVICEKPLPDGKTFAKHWLQTKQFDCEMSQYSITPDGQLKEYELVLNYHGDIRMKGIADDESYGDYIARFTHGKLEWIKVVERK